MRFYQATTFLFPGNFQLRVFSVCFGAVHLPIIAFCVMQAVVGHWDWEMFASLLAATLVGTGVAIAALSALLAPISHATSLLQSVQRGERIAEVPIGEGNLVGALLTSVAKASAETTAGVSALADAAERDLLTGCAIAAAS